MSRPLSKGVRSCFIFLDDLIHSLEGYLSEKSQLFNAVVGSFLTAFLYFMLLAMLISPQLLKS